MALSSPAPRNWWGTEALIGKAGEEFVHEFGLPDAIQPLIEAAIGAGALNVTDNLWAHDALAFWAFQNESYDLAAHHVSAMDELIGQIDDNLREAIRLLTKKMWLCGRKGDVRMVRELFRDANRRAGAHLSMQHLVRHNYAGALYEAGAYEKCYDEALKLYRKYLQLLGLRQDELNGSNKTTWLFRMQAMKLFGLAGAFGSLIRYGQDIVDDFIGAMKDSTGARKIMETTMPSVLEEYSLTEFRVAVLGQYAVVLAYCGAKQEALAQMERLLPFLEKLPDSETAVLETQMQIVNKVASS